MTAHETAAMILAAASGIDSRMPQPDPAVLGIWVRVLGDIDPEDAAAALAEHYSRAGVDRVMPGDIVDGVRRIRKARLARFDASEVDADPDDVQAWLVAYRAGLAKAASPDVRPRSVGALIAGAIRELPA